MGKEISRRKFLEMAAGAIGALACAPKEEVCQLDKVGTFPELYKDGQYAGQWRIEVGGHSTQHVDYYPEPGVKAVSYIVGPIKPDETPAIWMGHGSIWQAKEQGCDLFNWIADTIRYASARLDSGHSGLVIDLRDTEEVIVANVNNIPETEIDTLLTLHREGQQQG